MSYTSFGYYILAGVSVLFYYGMPIRKRWIVLLAASSVFYILVCGRDPGQIAVFFLTILVSYMAGLLLERKRGNRKLLIAAAVISSAPLLLARADSLLPASLLPGNGLDMILPVGMAFYSLQIISYLADVSRGNIPAQRNFAKYALFVSFFPQILQGPIPRYGQLEQQLVKGHRFKAENIVRGYLLIVWGFFLKFMIADKAGIVVNTVYNDPQMYQGGFVLAAGVLYSLQLYADFLACTTISQGVSRLFGITLMDNFRHPYLAVAVKDFWRRWHLSLSSWLRDYIYIPLGGNRKGKVRKYINILITFAISGIWHGNGVHYLVWGITHAVYQILGELLAPFRKKVKQITGVKPGSRVERLIAQFITFNLVMLAWILFRASSPGEGIRMVLSIFTVRNPWIFFDDSMLNLGLSWKEWCVLFLSVCVLRKVSLRQEEGISLTDRLLAQPLFVRWLCYIAAALLVMVFGTYGFGFQAADFIYQQF